jgi:branched-chain amino acid transport system permease protein
MNKLSLASKSSLIPGIIWLVGLIILGTLPFYASIYTAILLSSIFMYIVLTSSWAMFSGPTGHISLATAAFFGVGIYIAAILGTKMPLLVTVLIGGLASSVLALLVGYLTLRLKGLFCHLHLWVGTDQEPALMVRYHHGHRRSVAVE